MRSLPSPPVPRLAATALVALALTMPGQAHAQFNEVPPPAAYALENVTMIDADGVRTEGVTILVRGALVEAIGPGIEIPPDAERLAGDSLLVYPGFVDADGEAAYEFPELDVDRSEVASWDPTRELQGFTPQRRVVDHLSATGDDMADSRKAGIVATAIHPDDAMMPGRGALLLLRSDAETPNALVLQQALGPVMTFSGARGAYPGTLFGVIAFYRQRFADATRQATIASAHAQNPQGMSTPVWDPAYEILQELMAGSQPVYFRADRADDIRRVLGLADELGLRPVIVGGEEAWKVADELAASGVPVLVSLDLPEPSRWEETDEEKFAGRQEAPEEQEAQEAEEDLDPAAWRERDRIQAARANPGQLAQAGVTVALTTGAGGAELLEGARLAIENGMSEEAALRSLTAAPAGIYGVPGLARVRTGFPATFIVTDGPLFDEDTRILYTFVEGGLEKGRTPRAEGEEPAVNVGGTWEIEINAEGMSIGGTMTLVDEDGDVTGEMALDVGSVTISDGTVSGTDVTFSATGDDGGAVEVKGTVEGDTMSGTGSAQGITFTWKATRKPGGVR